VNGRFAAILLSFSLALPCFAASGVSLAQTPAARPSDKEAWVARLREGRAAVSAALQRNEQADRDYKEMRHRNRARGEAKQKILEEREQAAAALEAAEQQMDELLETARRSGVPPGWIREAMDDDDPGAANQ
jgi:hypothetical protein